MKSDNESERDTGRGTQNRGSPARSTRLPDAHDHNQPLRMAARRSPTLLPMLALLLLHPLASSAVHVPASLRVTVEYAAAPLALEELAPRFSWTIPADGSQRGEMQTSYAIAVASSAAGLAAALATAPRVASNQSVLRRLTQPSELQPGALYYVQVVVTTTQRRGLTAASPVLLGTAPTEDDYKQASFIGLATAANTSCPWLRKDIASPPDGWAAPGRAIAYVASVGYHELYVSGVKASPDVLAPSVSDLVRKGLFYGI